MMMNKKTGRNIVIPFQMENQKEWKVIDNAFKITNSFSNFKEFIKVFP